MNSNKATISLSFEQLTLIKRLLIEEQEVLFEIIEEEEGQPCDEFGPVDPNQLRKDAEQLSEIIEILWQEQQRVFE